VLYVKGTQVGNRAFLKTNATIANNCRVRVRIKGTSNNARVAFRYQDKDNHYLWNGTSTGSIVYKRVGGTYTALDTVAGGDYNAYNDVEIIAIGTSIKVYINGTLYNNFTDSVYSSVPAALSGGTCYYDSFFAGKVVTPNPTYVVGDESLPQIWVHVATGGAIVGGAADYLRAVNYSMIGGGIAGGEALANMLMLYASVGGCVGGGAVNYTRTVGYDAEGGGLAGGDAATSRGKVDTMSGGGVAGGWADAGYGGMQTYAYTMYGGAVASGMADLFRSTDFTARGGGVIGGEGDYSRAALITAAGGAVAGGVAGWTAGGGGTHVEYAGYVPVMVRDDFLPKVISDASEEKAVILNRSKNNSNPKVTKR